MPPAHVPISRGENPRQLVVGIASPSKAYIVPAARVGIGTVVRVVICKSKALMHPKPSQNCASVSSNLDSIAGRTVEFRIDYYPSELFSAIRNEDVAPDTPKINPQICHFVDLNLGFLLSFFHRIWCFTF